MAIEEIVKIKEHREDAALNTMTKKERELALADQKLQERQKELKEYIGFRKNKENELYGEVINQKVKVRDLETLNSRVSNLRAKELDLEKEKDEAIEEKDEAKEVYHQAKDHYAKAVVNTTKMKEVARVVLAEEEAEKERAEEGELEEQASVLVNFGMMKEEWEHEP